MMLMILERCFREMLSTVSKNCSKNYTRLRNTYDQQPLSTGVVPNGNQYPVVKEAVRQMIGTGPMCRYAVDLLPMLKVMTKDCKADLNLDEPVSYFIFFLCTVKLK